MDLGRPFLLRGQIAAGEMKVIRIDRGGTALTHAEGNIDICPSQWSKGILKPSGSDPILNVTQFTARQFQQR